MLRYSFFLTKDDRKLNKDNFLKHRYLHSFANLSWYLDQDKASLCGLRVKLPPVSCYCLSNHSKLEAILLPKDTTSELAGLSPH